MTVAAMAIAAEIDPEYANSLTAQQHQAVNLHRNLADLRAATLWLEKLTLPDGAHVSASNYGISVGCTAYKPWGTYDYENESNLDVETSQHNMAYVLKQLRAMGLRVEKNYTDYEFQMIVRPVRDSEYKVVFSISRQTVCKQVVTGKEYVPPTEGHYREITEYECEKVSFSKLEKMLD